MTVLEQDPLVNLAKDGELMAYKHRKFWKAMDTLRDKYYYLNQLWEKVRLHGKYGKYNIKKFNLYLGFRYIHIRSFKFTIG